MPKNIKGGQGHKRHKNKPVEQTNRRDLIIRDGPAQNYGLITKALGDFRMSLVDPDNRKYIARIRGKLKGRQRIKPGDLVLFSYRDTGEQKVDIIMKYSEDQAKRIIRSEGLKFPESENSFLNNNVKADIVFSSSEEVQLPSTSELVPGKSRILAIYADIDDEDEDEEDVDEGEDVDSQSGDVDSQSGDVDSQSDDVDSQSGDVDSQSGDVDSQSDKEEDASQGDKPVDHKKKTIAQKKRLSERYHKTAGQMLKDGGEIDIDAI